MMLVQKMYLSEGWLAKGQGVSCGIALNQPLESRNNQSYFGEVVLLRDSGSQKALEAVLHFLYRTETTFWARSGAVREDIALLEV